MPAARQDPTRTKALRDRLAQQISARYDAIKQAITRSIVDNDCFGLRKFANQEVAGITVLSKQQLAAQAMQQQVEAFHNWLKYATDLAVVERDAAGQPWSDAQIQQAYNRGVVRGNVQVRQATGSHMIQPIDGSNVVGLLGHPAIREPLVVAKDKFWTALNGINAQMQLQINHELSRGLEAGLSPSEIARNINLKVDTVGKVRARMVARTEIVRAHNSGSVAEYDRLSEVIGEEILSQWLATLDDRVRSKHEQRHLKVFKSVDARALMGEPNCRCGLAPYVRSVEGPVAISTRNNLIDPA